MDQYRDLETVRHSLISLSQQPTQESEIWESTGKEGDADADADATTDDGGQLGWV